MFTFSVKTYTDCCGGVKVPERERRTTDENRRFLCGPPRPWSRLFDTKAKYGNREGEMSALPREFWSGSKLP